MVRCRLFALLSALLYGVPIAAQIDVQDVNKILATTALTVERLEPYVPPRFSLISSKLQIAAQRNPTWFRAQVANAKPGEPLPYEERLGVSRDEYTEYLRLVDSVVMKPVGTDTIMVTPTASGWRFGPATTLAELRGIEIDTVRGVAIAPYGELSAANPIMPSAEQRVTGPWKASRWQRQDVGGTAGTVATFAIGRFVESGQPILYHSAKELVAGSIQRRVDLVLRGAR